MIPYGRQSISDEDIEAVVDVLRSDWLTQGPAVPSFEKALASYCNVQHAVATNSATSALHIACLSLGVKAGDTVWTSPISFVASANCALYCNASVDFVDVNADTGLMSPDRLAEKLEFAAKSNQLPKVVIPVHLCGHSCDMQAIYNLSKKYGFKIIEDASHAIGGMYLGQKVGSCQYSDITIFSFHPVKIMTTAEGGVATTNDKNIAKKLALLRSHGITKDLNEIEGVADGDWYYQQLALGFNYRMTDIQAALGRSQLQKVDIFVEKRNQIAKRYRKLLQQNNNVQIVEPSNNCYSSFHLFSILLKDNTQRLHIFNKMKEKGIGVNVHYIPIVSQPYYKNLGFSALNFPSSQLYYARCLTLPLHPSLTIAQQDYVSDTLLELL